MDILVRIKRLVLHGAIRFTDKARDEMDVDGLTVDDVVEAVLNAQAITKTLRSRSRSRRSSRERLYVIKSFTFGGTFVYTKGTIVREHGQETFYIFISSKLADFEE